MKKRVLFVCIHNSARSQMAEAYLNHLGHELFHAESAGLEQGKLNPIVVEAMREDGIDISGHQSNTVKQFLDEGRRYDVVITVCDQASGQNCPFFPGQSERLHFEFPDPSALEGTFEEKLQRTRDIRDMIKKAIQEFVANQGKRSIFVSIPRDSR